MAEPPRTILSGVPSGPQTVGDMVRLGITYLDTLEGIKVNPSAVRFKYLEPGQRTPTTLVYGTDEELVRSSTGVYRVDLELPESGVWQVRWEAAGNYISAEEFSIPVATSVFV